MLTVLWLRGLFYEFFIVCWFYVKKYNQKLKFSSGFNDHPKVIYLNLFFFWIKALWSSLVFFDRLKIQFRRWNWVYFAKVCSWHFFYPCSKKIILAEILLSKSTKSAFSYNFFSSILRSSEKFSRSTSKVKNEVTWHTILEFHSRKSLFS